VDKHNKFYVDAQEILSILEKSVEQGLSIKSLLEDLDLSPQLLDAPLNKIDMEDCWRIITAQQNIIQEESHLVSTRPLKRGTTRFVFSNLIHCNTLQEGLELLADTYNMLHGGNYNFVRKRGNKLSFIVDDRDFHYREHAINFIIEFALIKIHCALTYLIGAELEPIKLCTKRNSVSDKNHHLNFFDCAIEFSHPHYELTYDASQADLAFRAVEEIDLSAHLLGNYLSIVEQRQKDIFEDTLIKKVMNKIKQDARNQEDVASAIGMSVPTLRRKLKFHGTSFRDLLDKVNSELAANDLLDQIPPADIAEKLGYCDVRSFKRAFKRWHGLSPAAFLKQH
jgi:AraC-like DNA-binding protein